MHDSHGAHVGLSGSHDAKLVRGASGRKPDLLRYPPGRQRIPPVQGPCPAVDRAALFPDVEIAEQFLYEREHLILGLSFALAKSARAGRSLDGRVLADRDLIDALTALAQSYQTRVESSLIYEQPMTNLAHQQIAREVETMLKEFRETEQKHMGYSRLRDSEVLKALVFLLRMGLARTSGRPKSRAFVDFLFRQFPENPSPIATPEASGSRIVIP